MHPSVSRGDAPQHALGPTGLNRRWLVGSGHRRSSVCPPRHVTYPASGSTELISSAQPEPPLTHRSPRRDPRSVSPTGVAPGPPGRCVRPFVTPRAARLKQLSHQRLVVRGGHRGSGPGDGRAHRHWVSARPRPPAFAYPAATQLKEVVAKSLAWLQTVPDAALDSRGRAQGHDHGYEAGSFRTSRASTLVGRGGGLEERQEPTAATARLVSKRPLTSAPSRPWFPSLRPRCTIGADITVSPDTPGMCRRER